jgi:photosystem II stability/assembly factor-like uncharacterized protein
LAGLADPRDASVGGLYRSDDGGENWRQLGADHLGRIQTISFCTAKPEVIVVTAGAPAARGNPESHPCTTWRTDDGGATWRQIDRRRAALAAVNPRDPKIVYLGTWGWDVTREPVGFWISSDDGTTWSDANRGLAISLGGAVDQLRFDVNNLRRLFLIHESGVYLGSDPS